MKFSEDEIEKIKEMVKQGKSSREIAKAVHRRLQDVQKQIREIKGKRKSRKMVRNPYGRKGKPKPAREVCVYGFIRRNDNHKEYKDVDFCAYVDVKDDPDHFADRVLKEAVPEGWALIRYPTQTTNRVDAGDREVLKFKKEIISEDEFIEKLSDYFATLPLKHYNKKDNDFKKGGVKANRAERDVYKKLWDEGGWGE